MHILSPREKLEIQDNYIVWILLFNFHGIYICLIAQ